MNKTNIILVLFFQILTTGAYGDTAIALDGRWSMGCVENSDTATQGSLSEQYVYQGPNTARELLFYRDLECKKLLTSMTMQGTIVVGGPFDQAEAFAKPNFKTDTIMQKYLYQIYDQNQVDVFNSKVACGFSDWKINVSKDLTGLDCSGFFAGTREYSIIKPLSKTQIQIGNLSHKVWDGSTEPKRARTVSPFVYKHILTR